TRSPSWAYTASTAPPTCGRSCAIRSATSVPDSTGPLSIRAVSTMARSCCATCIEVTAAAPVAVSPGATSSADEPPQAASPRANDSSRELAATVLIDIVILPALRAPLIWLTVIRTSLRQHRRPHQAAGRAAATPAAWPPARHALPARDSLPPARAAGERQTGR